MARLKWSSLSSIWKRLQAAKIQRSPRTFLLSSCWVALGRPFYLWTVLLGVPRHWRFPPASGGHPPRLIPPSGGGVYCLAPEAPQKRECRRGRRYFWPCRTRVGFGPATGPTLKTALCHIRALVGRNDKYRGPRSFLGCLGPFLSSSWVAFGRPSYLWAVLPGVPRHWRFPPASGGHPPRLLPLLGGWVYCLAPEEPQKGECRRGRRYFWPCRTRVGFGPATGPTLKTALCHIRALMGRNDK